MRELEFLPDWYPSLRKRKRTVGVQAYATVILISGLCLWGWLSGRNMRSASASLHALQDQLSQTDNELARLAEANEQKKELESKNQIIRSLGNHVETTRVMAAVEAAMPEEMALLDVTTEVKEAAKAMSGLAAAASVLKSGRPAVDRRMEITVRGVGPTDATLAKFMLNIGKSDLFDRVNLSLASERTEANHVMREFTVTFGVDLNHANTAAFSSRGVR
jgi:Tfp pilus assembly protein PilN